MMDHICIDWLSTGPELQLSFTAPAGVTLPDHRRTACRQNISKITARIFEKRFGIDIAIPAVIDEKAIRIRVKPKLEDLPTLLGCYDSQMKNRYLAADIRWCWEQLTPIAKKILAAENPAIQITGVEQVQGAVERLDALSFACEKKGLWEDIDLAEAKGNLSVIYYSRTREALVPAINAYFDTMYPSNEAHSPNDAHGQPTFDFLSSLLQEEERRRRNGLSTKIGARSAIE